ncbi:MAG: hypothetical protein QME59_02545 [Candidatus Hydrothermarchaeota archaeon]|nr:hypothetical protein [Candidatus Hydrothermarchaeota archaeon]
MSEVRNESIIVPLVGKTVRIPFDALVEELGLKGAVQFISKIKKNYGDSVFELKEKTKDLTMENIESRIK